MKSGRRCSAESPSPRRPPLSAKPTVLYVTDLAYEARGRRYCDEDIFLSSRLREDFTVALAHPRDVLALADGFDVVVVRNSGPVAGHRAEWEAFREHALRTGTRVFNSLKGRGDMNGKQYLADLSAEGYPVIPTVDRAGDLDRLPQVAEYVVKPRFGADSEGVRFVDRAALASAEFGDVLVQPKVDFRYEVSFYFVGEEFQYALYAPHPERRWEMDWYEPDEADMAFARRFVEWNSVEHGVQRVDACRTDSDELLLVELEDLNPYLSLDALDDGTREAFTAAVVRAIHHLLASS
jgi:hypothetical protein